MQNFTEEYRQMLLDREIEAVESFHISVALHAHHARHAVVGVCLSNC